MIKDESKFKDALKAILMEDGLCLDAGGEIFIRSLEGGQFCVGTLSNDGSIDEEVLHKGDSDEAIDQFIVMVKDRNLC